MFFCPNSNGFSMDKSPQPFVHHCPLYEPNPLTRESFRYTFKQIIGNILLNIWLWYQFQGFSRKIKYKIIILFKFPLQSLNVNKWLVFFQAAESPGENARVLLYTTIMHYM